jgi:hypothetical protein
MLMLVTSVSVLAQDARGDVFVQFTGVDAGSNCNGIGMDYIRSRTGDLFFVGQAFINGVKFHDDVLAVTGSSYGPSGWGFLFSNDRGDAIDLYPLTPGLPIDLSVTIFTADWQPIYEARARLSSCDSTTMAKSSSGPATQLLMNHNFELGGFDGVSVVPSTAAFWKGKDTTNDFRTCDGPPGPASAVFNGACGFKFESDLAVKSKIQQKYTGNIGVAGDLVYFLVHTQGFAGYGGGAKVQAKLTLANGSVVKLIPETISAGASTYGYAYDALAKLTSPIVSAKVKLQQGFGSGSIAFDAVTLSVLSNAPTELRTLPVPSGTRTWENG